MLEQKAREYEDQYGFPWEIVITLAIELITECLENRNKFREGRNDLGPFQEAALGWRIRRLAREEDVRVDVRGLRKQILADYKNLTDAECDAIYDQVDDCCRGRGSW